MLLSKVPDLKKRLFIDTLWNTDGCLNEILLLTKEDFCAGRFRSPAPLCHHLSWCCVPSSSVGW